jgi:signal transduction histidine kinase/ActR/RegA family two-component response regulator
MVSSDEQDRMRQAGENYLRQGMQKGWEIRWIRKDGQPIWVELRAIRIEEVGKQAILVNVMDVTEQKQAREEKKELQTQLQHAQKMEAIGSLAGGIAHDFNNILLPIIGYTEMAITDVPQGSLTRKNLGEVLKAAELAKGLVQQILTFSRRSKKERKPLMIQPIIKESLKLLRASLPSTIEIRQNIDNKCGAILADPTQIYQVMMNLCTNAYHAMREKGGILEVTLTEVNIDSPDLPLNLDLNQGPYLRLAISDTGHGMDRAVVERIFDPYFTTKAPGEGTGLGLSVVHGIIRSHDGYITVYSEPGEGTTFYIYLPRIDVDAKVPETISTEPAPKGEEYILFVDDDEQIVNVVQQILERLGYRVAARTSSVEALEAFQAQPEKFDLVITDLTMPNMTGTELAKRLIDIRSDIPIILCTGFSEAISKKKAKAIGIREYVMKPITMHGLAMTIRKVLDKDKG